MSNNQDNILNSKAAMKADFDVKTRTHIGGQALIEGIMMRGKYIWAVAIRQPDGTIHTESHDLVSRIDKRSWLHWPVIRGCTAFVESLILGYKALTLSTEYAFDWEDEESPNAGGGGNCSSPDTDDQDNCSISNTSDGADDPAQNTENAGNCLTTNAGNFSGNRNPNTELSHNCSGNHSNFPNEASSENLSSNLSTTKDEQTNDNKEKKSTGLGALSIVSVIFGTLLGIAIFIALPALLSNLVFGEEQMNTLGWNIFDGVIRVVIFVLYVWLISLMKDITRMFRYHGAEHQTIHCYEHGLELTPSNAAIFPRLHVRCGTAFLLMVMIIAILIYSILGQPINSLIDLTGITEGPLRFILVVLTRIILLPLIAGISYEVTVKWAGSHPENPFVKIILWPGLQMQKLTTKVPDESMLECAIAAMNIVLENEKSHEESADKTVGDSINAQRTDKALDS
ncbi:MAG: DUF1385 domain-containing protein [Coriobacteriales bacterium]|nr:DUF1385 domain-containing protein [Coriobacteriales bacterium]